MPRIPPHKRSRSPSTAGAQDSDSHIRAHATAPSPHHHSTAAPAKASPSTRPSPPVYSIKASPLPVPKRQGSSSPRMAPMLPPTSGLTSSAFTCPEITFHIEAARTSNTLNPRDVANLMLWAVPTTVPLVESPKWCFLKSRSYVKGVVTIYCNGISYDTIMNTGCGISADASEKSWHEAIGEKILFPFRRGCCHARNNEVCHVPIWVPSQNNRLELDLFLRTQSNRRTSTAPRRSLIDVAKEVASSAAAGTLVDNPSPPPTVAAAESDSARDQVEPKQCTDQLANSKFHDVEALLSYSLTMEANLPQLMELRFTVEVPEVSEGQPSPRWRRFLPPSHTPSSSSSTLSSPKIFAFDCEMVLVDDNVSALARCTLVQLPSEEVVLDILVKPQEPIIDYVTRFSGITEEMLGPVTTTLADAQDALMQFIDTETFVIGHSLENDFKACCMLPNCRVLDTTHLFPHPAGPPYKNALRYLAQSYLKRTIQRGEHDSAEDALTAAHLVELKLIHGPNFGMSSRVNILSLFPTHICNDPSAAEIFKSASAPIVLTLFDDVASMKSYAAAQCNLVKASNDDDAVKKSVKHFQKMERDILAQQSSSSSSGGSAEHQQAAAVFVSFVHLQECAMSSVCDDVPAELEKAEAINTRLMSIVNAVPDDTLINIIAANCRPGNGNQLSKAHGMLFSFVKDKKGRGPPNPGPVAGDGSLSQQSGCQQS
ncbi:exonuclease, putative [Bodo saltans]|uniref:Exonuclease, putative n=1 Tax=Bodo saltans TaxID=75058 RepID=A0A0S4JVL6_BODSA|nr:exonuclease, putative [Bodo saltans]|eukprot:CUG93443.1 exonuclease, putative [Bodo saltans]